ncbi:MAG: amidohydrolase family protein [Planctomycetota bacterium]|nr:amidohydrolase family protein [Planctomycetota bacterium]
MRPQIRSALAEELLATGGLRGFGVIDAHGHMGPFAGFFMPNAEPSAMLRTMDRCGVAWLIFSHHEALQDTVKGNAKAQAAIDMFPQRLRGYYAVNPAYPDRLRQGVAAFGKRRGFVGYKILAGYYRTAIDLPICQPLWEQAHEMHLPVLLHTWGGDQYAGPAQVEKIARRYPHAIIIMGHSMYGDWLSAIRLAKRYRNVYCELCAAYATGVVRKMVEEGIEDKILFGTDLPWFDPMYGIGCVVFARISETARRKILRENALRVFGEAFK